MVNSNEKYKEYRRAYYLRNREKILKVAKKQHLKNQADPELKKKRHKQMVQATLKWRFRNPEKVKEINEKTKEYRSNIYKKNPEKYKEDVKLWRLNNKEKHLKTKRKWAQANPDKIKKYADKYKPKAIIQRKKTYLLSDDDIKKKKSIW